MPGPPQSTTSTDADDSARSASESAECLGHGPEAKPPNHRCFLFVLVALLTALIGAGVVLPALLEPAAVRASLSAVRLAEERAIQNFTRRSGRGCANWRSIAFGQAVEQESAAHCQAKCIATSGCTYVNYQPAACSGTEQIGPKMCYLFASECVEGDNACWDIYETSLAKPFPFDPPSTNTGCANWKNISIGEVRIVWNKFECGNLCEKEEECSHFNFQESDCNGTEHVKKGACYLYKEGCKQEENRCWDLYAFAPNPIYVYADGVTPTALSKVVMHHSPLHMFYSIPLDVNKDVQVNSTHYFIPSNATVQAIYIRNTTVETSPGWSLDYGVANWKAFFNPVSIFPYVNFGFAEKLIRFGQQGADSLFPEKPKVTGDVDPEQTFQRNMLVNSFVFASRLGSSLAAAGLDPQQVAMVAGLAANGSPELDPQLAELAEQLRAMAGDLKHINVSMRSSNNCHHFANAVATAEGISLPLGKPWLSFKGLETFVKNAGEFWAAMGTTTTTFNAESNALEIFFSAASTSYLGELDSVAVSGGYYQGPPHTATDNRIQVQQPSIEANALFKQFMAIPADYHQFWQDGTCPPDKEAQIDDTLRATNFSALVLGVPTDDELMAAVSVATQALDCGHDYMQSSIPNSHPYGTFEAFVWMHLLLETPQSTVGDVATWRGWNDVSVVELF